MRQPDLAPHPDVADINGRMTDAQREDYNERAAIIEYDGLIAREEAERLAKMLVMGDE